MNAINLATRYQGDLPDALSGLADVAQEAKWYHSQISADLAASRFQARSEGKSFGARIANALSRVFGSSNSKASEMLAAELAPRDNEPDHLRLQRLAAARDHHSLRTDLDPNAATVATALKEEVKKLAAPNVFPNYEAFREVAAEIHKNHFLGNEQEVQRLQGLVAAHHIATLAMNGYDPLAVLDHSLKHELHQMTSEKWRGLAPADRLDIERNALSYPEWDFAYPMISRYENDRLSVDQAWAKNLDADSRLQHAELAAQNIQDPAKAEQARYTLELISAHRIASDEIGKIRNEGNELCQKIFDEGLILAPDMPHFDDMYYLADQAERLNKVLVNTGVIPSVDAPLERIEHVRELADLGLEAALEPDR